MIDEKQIQNNWNELIQLIEDTFEGERKEKLLEMYEHFKDRMMFAPASGQEHFHNCFPGGYVEHILNIVHYSKEFYKVWKDNGAYVDDYTEEELIFAAMHHDLGKIGDLDNEYYIPQTSDWHRTNRGEIYTHNPDLSYMKVPDRGLWLLQHYGIKVTEKEYIGIKLTDGLYDEANKSYLMSYNPDWSLRSNMAYILHQADMMATHIEYDQWKRGNNKSEPVNTKVPKDTKEQKKVDDLKSKFDELFA